MRAALSAARCLTASAILQRGMMQAVWHQQQLHQQCLQGSSSSRSLGVARQALWQQHSTLAAPARERCCATKAAAKQEHAVLRPHTSVEAAISAAAAQTGLSSERAAALSEHLRENWYETAGDVLAMGKEELQHMRLPVKVWAAIKSLLAAAPPEGSGQGASSAASLTAAAEAELDTAIDALGATTAAAPAATQQQLPPLPADIMQRRMPRNLVGAGAKPTQRVRVRKAALLAMHPYGLTDDDKAPNVLAELAELQAFCCGTFAGQRVAPMRAVSFRAYRKELMQLLGYLHSVRGVPLQELRLRWLVPSPERSAVSLLLEYQHWRQTTRGVAPRSQVMPIKAVIALTRFLYHDCSDPASKPPYRDVPVMQELSVMLKIATKAANAAPLVADEAAKFMTWPEYLRFVAALRAECAGMTASGQLRDRKQVALSLQRYLIAAILSVVPDRQRTLRELEVGRTLVQRDGAWVITHAAADYKTGKQYGDRPPLVLAPFLYPELEAFIGTWRQELNPGTPRLFVRPGSGGPHTGTSLLHMFQQAALRLTGKATNPHLVRDMIVTHLRQQGATEQELESLALMMGHSVALQRSVYDRRTRAEKVRPAVDLMLDLSRSLHGTGM